MKNKLQEQINNDALLREVVEDVQNEQLQQFWNKYGILVIVAVALILTATISFESIKGWQMKKQQELSTAYAVALSLQTQGRLDESMDYYGSLMDKTSGIYADLSRLQIANIYTTQNNNDDAISVLQSLIDDTHALPQLRTVAILKLASLKMDMNAPANDIKALLNPLLEQGETSDIAQEFLAMLSIREKDFAQAKKYYQQLVSSATASDDMKARAQDMINILAE